MVILFLIIFNNFNFHSNPYSTTDTTSEDHPPLHRRYLPKPHPQIKHGRTGPMATRQFFSYLISFGHLVLYLPAMLIVGLVGKSALPPIVACACAVVVYSEFLIQSMAILCLSPKFRNEVFFLS